MQTQPLVSIIIPTYNREKLLPRAINSVLSQTYQNWELIIVDDRSTDNTEALVQEYMRKDTRIKYIKNTHKQGPAGARNQGIEVTNGEYIAFLDSDDEYKPFHLEEVIEEFEKNKDVDWIYVDNERIEDDKIVTKSVFQELWKGKDKFVINKKGNLVILDKKNLMTNILKYSTYAGPQVSVILKKLFSEIRFDEELFGVEDRLLPLEAIAKGFKLAYIEKIHVSYYVGNDNLSLSDPDKLVSSALEKLFKKIFQRICLTQKQKRIVNNNLADFYFWQMGYNYHLQIKDYKKAKEYFLKGIMLNPFNLKYWKTYILRMILGM